MRVVVVTPPSAPLIALADAKAHLRVEHNDHDALIGAHVAACADWLDGPEGILGLALGEQTLRFDRAEGFVGLCGFELPMRPGRKIEEIAYRDSDGATQTVDEELYELDTATNQVRLADGAAWPTAPRGPVTITYSAGSGVQDLPPAIRTAMLLHLNILYDQPEEKALAALERARDALLGPKRKRRV